MRRNVSKPVALLVLLPPSAIICLQLPRPTGHCRFCSKPSILNPVRPTLWKRIVAKMWASLTAHLHLHLDQRRSCPQSHHPTWPPALPPRRLPKILSNDSIPRLHFLHLPLLLRIAANRLSLSRGAHAPLWLRSLLHARPLLFQVDDDMLRPNLLHHLLTHP